MSTQKTLSRTQKLILGLAIVPMIAVGIAGGIGSYSNISHAYGSGTAVGALAAGEGATAVLAMILLGLTLLGQSSPLVIRLGLWALPATAAVMATTAARDGLGQHIVYAATPLAITAAAEGLAFLVRRIVVHQEGRDVEAEARAAAVIRDLAYHRARAAAHPSAKARKRSVRRSWRLARKVGTGDVQLGGQLIGVQRTRLVAGADAALADMFTPGLSGAAPELPPVFAAPASALPPASEDDAAAPQRRDATIHAETSGDPAQTASGQVIPMRTVRAEPQTSPAPEKDKSESLRSGVLRFAAAGLTDIDYVIKSLAALHGRNADDPKFRATVRRYARDARRAQADTDADSDTGTGLYM